MTDALTMAEQGEILVPADPMVSMIERVAMDPSLPIERLSALMDMRERQMDKEAEQAFNQAFAAAMGEMPDIPKTGKNDHTKKRYSTLDDLIRTTRPILARHGLSLNWKSIDDATGFAITAVVRHSMGYNIETTRRGDRDSSKQMNPLQGGGSTETYLKRYSGFSILGLSSGDEIDDDGRGSSAPATISAEQFITLKQLIEDTNTDEAKFHMAYGSNNPAEAKLEEFPARLFNAAKAQLERKKDGQNG